MSSILESSKNKVYKYFLERSLVFLRELEEKGFIIKTPIDKKRYGKSESDNSFSFNKLENSELKTLEKIFGSMNKKKATKGQGQERKRILTMHSSALLALLFFNSVSDKNPLCIKIDGNQYEFTTVDFEYENRCLEGMDKSGKKYRSSCIDVKLTDKAKNVVLFLESKFSEYLHNGKQTGINKEYQVQYGYIFDESNLPEDFAFVDDTEKGTLTLTTRPKEKKCSHYCQGLKQMMCHFIGTMNYKKDNPGEEVMLGTILLDLSSIDKTSFDKYSKDYSQLSENLNGLGKGVKMLKEPLTYQELYKEAKEKGFKLSDNVVRYYGLGVK